MRTLGDDFDQGLHFYQIRSAAPAPWPQPLRSWLAQSELAALNQFRDPQRRVDWLAGRWCAKQLLAEVIGDGCESHAQLQIVSRNSSDRGCAPMVFRSGVKLDIQLSISHGATLTVAVAAESKSGSVGVDAVERIELPDSFATTWFSPAECRRIRNSCWSIAAGWAAKEAVFKAGGDGLPFRPRRIRIAEIDDAGCLVTDGSQNLVEVRFAELEDALIAVARMPHELPSAANRNNRSSLFRQAVSHAGHETENAA